jgi:VWFA-related protein
MKEQTVDVPMPFRLCLLLAVVAIILFAQPGIPPDELQMHSSPYWPPSQPALKVETRLVEVGVVVRDNSGRTIAGLTRDNFEISDSGKKREITAFSAETRTAPVAPANAEAATSPATAPPAPPSVPQRPPRFLGLVFDDLNMTAADLPRVRIAAKRFLDSGLQPDDLVGVFFTSSGLTLPFTADRARLSDAIDHLTFRERNALLPACPTLTAYDALSITQRLDIRLLPIKVEEAQSCGYCLRKLWSSRLKGADAECFWQSTRPRSERGVTGPNCMEVTDAELDCARQVQALARSTWEVARDSSYVTIRSLSNIVDTMARMPGKRVLVYASSGFLSRTLEQDLEGIIDRALRADVVVNSLDAKGLYTQDVAMTDAPKTLRAAQYRFQQGTLVQWISNDTMAILSSATGGLFFHNDNDLNIGFRELGLAPESSYVLGFSPPPPDNRYHTLKVSLKSSTHYQLQARHGYFSAPDPAKSAASERRIDKELVTESAFADIPAQVTGDSVVTPTGGPGWQVRLHLDVPHLRFTTSFGIRNLKLTFLAALFDANDSYVAGQQGEVTFALKEDSSNRLAGGMDTGLTLVASPGKYRLRTVLEDEAGKLTTSSQPIEILAAAGPARGQPRDEVADGLAKD